jgi:hypothetical protein
MAGILARDFFKVSLPRARQDCPNNSVQIEWAGWSNETSA